MVDFIQKKELNMAARTVRTINSLEPQAAAMRREDFLQKTKEFSRRLKSGETKEDILPEAYALCREAARRTLGKRPCNRGRRKMEITLQVGVVVSKLSGRSCRC